jgi:hypothetical protein
MPPSVSAAEERGLTSFSSLLERLTGIGTGELGLPWQETAAGGPDAFGVGGDDLDDGGGVTYKPWPIQGKPIREKPRQGTKVRQPRKASPQGVRASQGSGLTASATEACAPARAPADAGRQWVGAAAKPVGRGFQGVSNQNDVPDLRRSTVSIRLNQEETALLRRRAAESGISVSEYVRSCVVEAEQLRLQVRQVVADMRFQPELKTQKMRTKQPLAIKLENDRPSFWSQLMARLASVFGASNSALRQPANSGLRFL